MSNHVKMRDLKRGGSRWTKVSRNRKVRSKTFSSEEGANTWAKSQGFEKFSLVNMKTESSTIKKIKVVVE